MRRVFSCTCAVNTRLIITYYKQMALVIALKLTQKKTFWMIMKSLYGLCNSKLQQIYAKKQTVIIMSSGTTWCWHWAGQLYHSLNCRLFLAICNWGGLFIQKKKEEIYSIIVHYTEKRKRSFPLIPFQQIDITTYLLPHYNNMNECQTNL